ncbi:MAG: hypothetical protein J5934_04290 [Succinivibrio sp.]|nr:hypothetical protein [Succinivibrio sp.]
MKLLHALMICSFSVMALTANAKESDYSEHLEDKSVTYVKPNGSATVSLKLLEPEIASATTKSYAQYTMDSYQGWDLKPVLDLRGFSFKYVDNAPCSALLTYFDGRSYILFQACGDVEQDDLKALFSKAGRSLKLEEILKIQLKPNTY